MQVWLKALRIVATVLTRNLHCAVEWLATEAAVHTSQIKNNPRSGGEMQR